MDTSRFRAMPLVPEPFEELCLSSQSVSFGFSPMARTFARFCPRFDIPEYRKGLSEEKKTELDKRAGRFAKRAIGNQLYKFSEFSWEVCTWRDVFGLIMDDEGLRMDKRPYEYVETDDSGQRTVKTRIPDATMGLPAYDDWDLDRGYVCSVPDCKDDHSAEQPDERLSQDRLRDMMHNPECGLVVDGVWGKTDLVFPFAVYEAKKRAANYEDAKGQIYHACKTYLAMLDDLARDPDNVEEYQTEDSSRYQLFAFTSCGSWWEVYLAWNFLGGCHVETIWRGDVKEFSSAFDLVCIVDQIHDYAAKIHRPFVMKHLEAWHARHERLREPVSSSLRVFLAANSKEGTSEHRELNDPDSDDYDSAAFDESCDFEFFTSLIESSSEMPEWFHLKQASKITRQDKAQETRERNRNMKFRENIRSQDINAISPGKKRGRAGPTKAKTKATTVKAPKRRRAQPPKPSIESLKPLRRSTRTTRRSTQTQLDGSQ